PGRRPAAAGHLHRRPPRTALRQNGGRCPYRPLPASPQPQLKRQRASVSGTCFSESVSGHIKPATLGGMKSSHFEKGEIRCRGTSTFLVLTESTYGESAQDGENSFDSIAACVALVPAA